MTPVLLAGWLYTLGIFLLLAAGLLLLAMMGAIRLWQKLRQMGTPLPLGRFLLLRWRGVDVLAVTAAYWSAGTMGQNIPLEDWVSFAAIGVDVVNLAGALGAAGKLGIQTSLGTLGAAALAGYDPLAIVQEAARRRLPAITATELTQLPTWNLPRVGNCKL